MFVLIYFVHANDIITCVQLLRLEFMLIAFPGVYSLQTILLYAQTIISHHIHIPSTLLLFFYGLQIMVELFILLIADFTKIFRS